MGIPHTGATCHRAAIDWLDSERANLVAAIEHATTALPSLSWQLTDALAGYLHLHRHDTDLLTIITAARQTTRDDPTPKPECLPR